MVNITFQNGDPAWFVMYSEFQFDHFQVSDLGKLKLLNAENVAFVDKDAVGGCKYTLYNCLSEMKVIFLSRVFTLTELRE